jgi:chromosome segregation ATPase
MSGFNRDSTLRIAARLNASQRDILEFVRFVEYITDLEQRVDAADKSAPRADAAGLEERILEMAEALGAAQRENEKLKLRIDDASDQIRQYVEQIATLRAATQVLTAQVAYAEDAAAKGELARLKGGDMEAEIEELGERVKNLEEALRPFALAAQYGKERWVMLEKGGCIAPMELCNAYMHKAAQATCVNDFRKAAIALGLPS